MNSGPSNMLARLHRHRRRQLVSKDQESAAMAHVMDPAGFVSAGRATSSCIATVATPTVCGTGAII